MFKASMKDEDVAKCGERIAGEIEKLGGTIADRNSSGVRPFARILNKQESGAYINIRFALAADKMAVLEKRLRLTEDIFRFQIIRHTDVQPVAVPATAEAHS